MPVLLGYGARPLPCPEVEGVSLRTVAAPRPAPLADLSAALDAALAHPAGARPLATVATARSRVVVVVGGGPAADGLRGALFAAVRRALAAVPDDHLTVAVASGPCGPRPPELADEALRRHRVVVHDPRDAGALVEMGRTSRGTRVRVNRCVAEADLVVTAGRVSPDPFAGYGGGAMGIFPGLASSEDAWRNHALAADPAAALGVADGNPCREDLEEAVRRLGRDTYMLDVVAVGGAALGAVAGDVVYAHRDGVRLARPWCEVEAEPADAVVASAPLPASSSLCEATRLLAPAGLLLREGGAVILAAECPEGTGPLDALNERLFEGGVRRYLPERHAVGLVSGLDAATVGGTFATFAPSLAAALERARALSARGTLDVAVLPDAADLVPRRARG
jgi:nickel-dependent lactate racemase